MKDTIKYYIQSLAGISDRRILLTLIDTLMDGADETQLASALHSISTSYAKREVV